MQSGRNYPQIPQPYFTPDVDPRHKPPLRMKWRVTINFPTEDVSIETDWMEVVNERGAYEIHYEDNFAYDGHTYTIRFTHNIWPDQPGYQWTLRVTKFDGEYSEGQWNILDSDTTYRFFGWQSVNFNYYTHYGTTFNLGIPLAYYVKDYEAI